nr:hypothetical protein [Gemmatimonadaceae bacterium]
MRTSMTLLLHGALALLSARALSSQPALPSSGTLQPFRDESELKDFIVRQIDARRREDEKRAKAAPNRCARPAISVTSPGRFRRNPLRDSVRISGIVTVHGRPVQGATVDVPTRTPALASDSAGRFSVTVPTRDGRFVGSVKIRWIGTESQAAPLTLKRGAFVTMS